MNSAWESHSRNDSGDSTVCLTATCVPESLRRLTQGLVKLLASNPADKEVLKATAHALKFMIAERPAYESLQRSSSRWLRVLGRQGSQALLSVTGLHLSPGIVSSTVLGALIAAGVFLALSLVKPLVTKPKASSTRQPAVDAASERRE